MFYFFLYFSSFLSDPGIPGPIYESDSLKQSERGYVNLTDVTLADEDTDSILTDNTNRAIQGNIAMQVTQPSGQVCNLCKWRHLMANIRTNTSDLVETKMM